MKASLVALFAATLAVAGCGNSGPSDAPGGAANNPGGGASGTDTSPGGGASPGSGGASGVQQTGGIGDNASTGGELNNGSGAGGVTSNTAGSGSSSGGTVGMAGNGVMGTANAPSVTFTEYAIPTNTGAPDSNPGEIAEGPDGNIWFNHQSTAPNAIQSITPTGTFSAVFHTSTTNIGPVAVTGGPDGNVYYTKQGGVGQAQPSGAVKEFGVPNGGDSGGITKGPDGKLWFTEPTKNMITNMTTGGQFKQFPIPTANSTPFAITTGPDMNLWFTESGTAGNKIGKITTAGVITEYPIATAAANAQSITAGPDGNLWFTELDGHKLGKITPAGVITEYGLPSAASPGDIVAGKDGNLWFAEAGTANSIARATPADGSVAEYQIPLPPPSPRAWPRVQTATSGSRSWGPTRSAASAT